MNKIQYRQAVQNAVKPKFKGKKEIAPKKAPQYPMSAEREMRRMCRGYMQIFKKALKSHLPAMLECFKEVRKDARFDAAEDTKQKLERELQSVAEELEQAYSGFDVEAFLDRIAELTKAQSNREWKKMVSQTLGVDILEDYYKGDLYNEMISKWTSDNVNKIKSLSGDYLNTLEDMIMDAFLEGRTIGNLQKDIQESFNVTENQAEFIARDQIGTLSGELAEMQQRDAGVTQYIWSTSKDERVRPCHAEFEGKTFDWDNPPEIWYDTKSNGRVYTGRFCHPGEDYQCRCVALPVFAWQKVEMPISDKDIPDNNVVDINTPIDIAASSVRKRKTAKKA